MTSETRLDLTRIVLAVLSIAGLIAASVWILRPFLGAIIWAMMIVVATWPLLLRTQRLLWNKRWAAVLVLTAALSLLLFVPLSLAIAAIVENADEVVGWVRSLRSFQLPAPPPWLAGLPLIGPKAVDWWQHMTLSGLAELGRDAAPYAATVAAWLIGQVGSGGLVVLQFLLTVIIAAIMYAGGERAGAMLLRFGYRLAGERGEQSMLLAGRAIRGVALGVVVTALVQSVLGGIGLAVCGVPFAALLSGVMFLACIAQIGVVPVLVPAIVWLYWSGDVTWGTVLLVWALVVGSLDNVLRPILIRKGADLPLLLIFAGVIGGLITFGLIGIFVGPVVLAVTYTLLDTWIKDQPYPVEPIPPSGPPAQ